MKNSIFAFLLIPLLGCGHTEPISPQTEPIHTSTHQTKQIAPLITTKNIQDQNITLSEKPKVERKEKLILDVPLINQNPELKYGCEVTSLTMVLQYAGINTNKMELYKAVKKDNDPIVRSGRDIVRWGDPAEGFVGDMTGKNAGYAVFDKPLEDLVNSYMPGKAVNLTNQEFDAVLDHVAKGYPVVVWTTGDYNIPDRPESWTHGDRIIETPLDLHAVVLVGYDQQNVYLNDPLSGKKQVPVSKERFIASWKALKSRAISYQE